MKKILLLPALLSCVGLLADKPNQKTQKQEPYDADLFRKNVEVVSTHLEFLYWTVRENNLDFAVKAKHPADVSLSSANGNYKIAKFEWDPGFRVALSYYNAPKTWELWTQYTWLHSKGDQAYKPSGQPDLYLTATWPTEFLGTLASATSHLNLHYNVFDLTAARVFIPNPHFRLRFLGGLMGTMLDQSWKINYYDAGDSHTTYKNTWDYWGAGIRLGTNLDWYIHGDCYLTGRATTGLVLGRYHNHTNGTTNYLATDDSGKSTFQDAYYADTRVAYTVQFAFGPSFQKRFDSCRIELFAGYEFNAWFNVQEVMNSSASYAGASTQTTVKTGTLSFDGLTARFTIDF